MTSHEIVSAVDLCRTYRAGSEDVKAVDEVTLAVESGQLVALIGESGSGKSTLLNLLGGLDLPDDGTLRVLGVDMVNASDAERATLRLTKIGFVFQSLNLFNDLTLEENVSLPLEGNRVKRVIARGQARRALHRVGLAGLEDRYPDHVSGGQQQRCAIARSIVGDRALVLADEPTGALDSVTGRDIMTLLHSLCADGTTVIVSTHNKENLQFADRVLELKDGRQTTQRYAER